MTTGNCQCCAEAEFSKHYPIFNLNCFECRRRYLLSEPCKMFRQEMVKQMWMYDKIPEWKVEPSCGCKGKCKRLMTGKKLLIEKDAFY